VLVICARGLGLYSLLVLGAGVAPTREPLRMLASGLAAQRLRDGGSEPAYEMKRQIDLVNLEAVDDAESDLPSELEEQFAAMAEGEVFCKSRGLDASGVARCVARPVDVDLGSPGWLEVDPSGAVWLSLY
jgi:hypothetical protein